MNSELTKKERAELLARSQEISESLIDMKGWCDDHEDEVPIQLPAYLWMASELIDIYRDGSANGTGHWTESELDAASGKAWVCSECGYQVLAAFLFGKQIMNYCPYCGAKMKGGADHGETD